MDTEQSPSREPVAAPNHIIERPRLIKLMEESGARVIVLHAPAGYGKTTLARQWVEPDARTSAWYRCTPASADIAVLAPSLVSSLAAIVPAAGDQLQQLLRASTNLRDEVDRLVELLVEGLASWPPAAWLIVDDQHFLGSGAAAETLLEAIVLETSVRVLSTSRVRPRWASTRRILYGEVLDLDQQALAFTPSEARQVLGGSESLFAANAQGWPAVVGLASRLAADALPQGDLPEELFDFLAEELFQEAPEEIQRILLKLALCPTLAVQMLTRVLDREETSSALSECEDLGFVHRTREGELEMHPLLRSFLVEKIKRSHDPEVQSLPERIGLDYLQRKSWDEVFALQLSFPSTTLVSLLLERAADDMLDAGRLETVARWLEFAGDCGIQHPIVDLAAAKVAFRQADHARAEVLAASAADMLNEDDPSRADALITAGQAAMLGDRTLEARDFFNRARTQAKTSREIREALIGDFFASLELEHSDASQILAELEAFGQPDPQTKLRIATARLLLSSSAGGIESAVALALPLTHLVDRVEDPHTTSSFLYALAGMAALSAHYSEALTAAERALEIARDLVLDFAVPHAKTCLAAALMGLRKYASAAAALEDVERWAERSKNAYATANASAFRARLLLMQGKAQEVLDLLPTSGPVAPPGLVEEQRMIRALALACEGALEEAMSSSEVLSSKRSEGMTLKACTRAIVRLQDPTLADETPQAAYTAAVASGNFDSLVCAYRGFPELLRQLSEAKEIRPKLVALLSRANDRALASRLGLAPAPRLRDSMLLSNRERDVFGLLCEGLSNQQIANALFLSPATVKVHLRHIYGKLGVQNRTQAILSAREL